MKENILIAGLLILVLVLCAVIITLVFKKLELQKELQDSKKTPKSVNNEKRSSLQVEIEATMVVLKYLFYTKPVAIYEGKVYKSYTVKASGVVKIRIKEDKKWVEKECKLYLQSGDFDEYIEVDDLLKLKDIQEPYKINRHLINHILSLDCIEKLNKKSTI
jgi:hypothetical protein